MIPRAPHTPMKSKPGPLKKSIAIAATAVFLSACSSMTYRADTSAKPDGFQLSGGYESHLAKTWPLTSPVYKKVSEIQPGQGSLVPLAYLVTIPIDLFIGWGMHTTYTEFDLYVNAKFVDQHENPISGFPLTVELEGISQKSATTGNGGEVSVGLTSDVQTLPTSTFSKSLSFHFTNDWQGTLTEKGEAVEIAPESISTFLKCTNGACYIESQDHKPIKDLTFRVQRIEHLNPSQKIAYAKQQAQAEADRKAQEEIERKQEQVAQEKADSERKKMLWRFEHRDKVHFTSFEEARTALAPSENGETEYSQLVSLIKNPMSLKGQVIVVRAKIVQAIGSGQYLMTNYPSVQQMSPGGDIPDSILMGFVTSIPEGNADFVDDQVVDIVAEITGTFQYTTTMQSAKTVPKLRIYGMRPDRR